MDNAQRSTLDDVIAEACGTRDVLAEPDLDLVEAGLLDSMAFVELIVGIDEKLDVSVPPTEVDRSELSTVNKIVAFVDERL